MLLGCSFKKSEYINFLNLFTKKHIQPCLDMQLFELMPFFQRLQGVAFQPSSKTQYLFSQRLFPRCHFAFFSKVIATEVMFVCLFSQRLVAWVCLTFFFKGWSLKFSLPFFSKAFVTIAFAFFSKAQTTYVSPAIKALTAAGKS